MKLLLLGAVLAYMAEASCSLTCEKSSCTAQADAVQECLQNVPYNQEWAENTIDVLSQSLQNFGFNGIYHDSGPPYDLKIDLLGEVAATTALLPFANDFLFQEHIQGVLQSLQDAHTRYRKPACYGATFVLPFVLDMRIDPSTDGSSLAVEPRLYLQTSAVAARYAEVYPELPPAAYEGKRVLLIDGVEAQTAVAAWGDSHETRSNDKSARFNAALRSFMYRDASSLSVGDLAPLALTLDDGSKLALPWVGVYKAGLGDAAACVDPPNTTAALLGAAFGDHDESQGARMVARPAPLDPAVLRRGLGAVHGGGERRVVVPVDSNSTLSCFVQSTPATPGSAGARAGVQRVLVMRVASFSPDGEYHDAWEGFLGDAATCLDTAYDMVVVDVMQNGGGYVCLGLRLLQMLIKDFGENPKLVQMVYDLPKSDLMKSFVEATNYPDPYFDPQEVEQILDPSTQRPFPDGKAFYYPGRNVTQGGVLSRRTQPFTLNCMEANVLPTVNYRPKKWVDPSRLIILTDGTCGSTCASFSKIAQEAGKATFIGAGGLWGQPMDVSSFAGGFVCNPGVLANIAANSSQPAFPQFINNQRWQFGWATWYSARFPSRFVQFTAQEPDLRTPFWSFAHPSVATATTTAALSKLYDDVIATSLLRLSRLPSPAPTDAPSVAPYVAGIATLSVTTVLGFGLFWRAQRQSPAPDSYDALLA